MKKVFIPTTLALFIATGLVAGEPSQSATAATEATMPTNEKMAMEKDANPAPTTKVTEENHMTDAANHADNKTAAPMDKKGNKMMMGGGKRSHHSMVNRAKANQLTADLNKMTCPSSATPMAPAA